MTRFWMGSAAAVMAVSIAGVNAQSTGSQTPQTQTPQTSASQQAMGETTTLKGCVYKEEAIPGRTPNVAERAGVMEDYILVVSDKSASASATGTAGTATGSQTATGTSGAASMHKAFKLENIADERLSAVVGKMVEVTGRVDAEAGDKAPTGTSGTNPDRSVGPDQIELAEFEVTNLKEVEGTCPATPQIKK